MTKCDVIDLVWHYDVICFEKLVATTLVASVFIKNLTSIDKYKFNVIDILKDEHIVLKMVAISPTYFAFSQRARIDRWLLSQNINILDFEL